MYIVVSKHACADCGSFIVYIVEVISIYTMIPFANNFIVKSVSEKALHNLFL